MGLAKSTNLLEDYITNHKIILEEKVVFFRLSLISSILNVPYFSYRLTFKIRKEKPENYTTIL